MSTETPRGIEVIEGAWDRCSDLIDYLDGQGAWARSQVNATRPEADYRTSDTVTLPTHAEGRPAFVDEFIQTAHRLMDNYAFLYGVPVYGYEEAIVNRYLPGQHFGTHPDYFRGSDRVFSAVVYLNTIEDGGATSFVHYGHDVQAREGRMVIFPANYLFAHAGSAPVHQTKYSAAFWARG
jgi:prolyl 4-hydroxylase